MRLNSTQYTKRCKINESYLHLFLLVNVVKVTTKTVPYGNVIGQLDDPICSNLNASPGEQIMVFSGGIYYLVEVLK